MKKIVGFFIAGIMAANLFAQQAGHIKITLVGAQCNRETWDDALQLDGKGDEVFFHFDFVLAAQNGSPKLNYDKRTDIYGDKTNANWSNRVKVGSAVDLFGNNMGGIKGGDKFTCNDLMGEYDMEASDVLSIIPTVWEWDGGPDIVTSFTSTLNSLSAPIANKAVQIAASISPALGDISNYIISSASMVLPGFTNVFSTIFGKAGDRPVGMASDGFFGPKTILIKTSWLQTLVNSNFGYGPGVIAVNYNEEALDNTRDHGNYSILIKFEFIPKTYTPVMGVKGTPPQPQLAAPAITIIDPAKPNNTDKRNLLGTWVGTSGSGQNSGPDYYAITLSKDGTFKQLNQKGEVLGTGSYKFDNNQFTAFYDNVWLKNITTTGTISGNELSGTWGLNGAASGSGKWVVIRKIN
jgi:hypothetical protein